MATPTVPGEPRDEAQRLHRGLSLGGLLALAVSDITPMASLLIISPVVLSLSGTAGLWAYIIGCFIALNVAACMGEMGSIYPFSGGQYSIVHRVLGGPVGFIAMVDYVTQAVFLPATIALGIGTYLHSLDGSLPVGLMSAIAMAIVTILAVLRIQVGALLIAVFLVIEVSVITLLTIDGVTHLKQPLSILTHPQMLHHGVLTSVAVSAIVATLAQTLFSVNGYDSTINFSEEHAGPAANIGKAVVIAAATGIILELVPFTAGLFGAQSLHAYLLSSTPLTDLVKTTWGHTMADIIIIGALFAVFNAVLAITLQFARIVWSSARDRAWPEGVNNVLGRVHPRFRSPWVATLCAGTVATGLCFYTNLGNAVTFTSVLIVALYAMVAVSALVSRIRDRDIERPSRMRLWPVPPLIALVGVGIAISQQKASDLIIVGAIFLAALVFYYLYHFRHRKRPWVPHTHEEQELEAVAVEDR